MWWPSHAVSETLGEERKWVHYGLTSTDVVDTAYGYHTNKPTTSSARTLKTSSTSSLTKRKNTSSLSWWVVPRCARWAYNFSNCTMTWHKWSAHRAFDMRLLAWVGKISGAVGNHNIPPFVENTSAINWVSVLKNLYTGPSRDLHAEYFAVLRARILSSGWQLKSVVFKIWTTWSGRILCQRSKRIFSKCLTNGILSVLKTWPVLRVLIRGHMVTAYET